VAARQARLFPSFEIVHVVTDVGLRESAAVVDQLPAFLAEVVEDGGLGVGGELHLELLAQFLERGRLENGVSDRPDIFLGLGAAVGFQAQAAILPLVALGRVDVARLVLLIPVLLVLLVLALGFIDDSRLDLGFFLGLVLVLDFVVGQELGFVLLGGGAGPQRQQQAHS